MTSNHLTIQCAKCNAELKNGSTQCPQCGSVEKNQQLKIGDTVEIYDSLDAKLKDPSLKSDDKLRVHLKTGDDLRKSDGKWMKKERLIDRDNDKYKESVIDPSTGEIVHHCEEALSQHINHGTAKKDSN